MAYNHCLRPPQIQWNTKLSPKRIEMDRDIVMEEEFAIHNMRLATNKRRVIFTVVVTPQSVPPLDFERLRSICKESGLICPVDYICYNESLQGGTGGKRDLIALIYRPFTTLHSYIDDFKVRNAKFSVTDTTFVGFMRGVVVGLYNLQQKGYGPAFINSNTLVMGDNDRGGSLLLISLNKEGRTNQVCNGEFRKLQTSIKSRVGTKDYNLDFVCLLQCMDEAESSPQRRRLVQAPFFYSDDEKVHVLITKFYIAMWATPEFKFRAKTVKPVIRFPINYMNKSNKDKDVAAIWKTTDPKVLAHAFDICMFLRTCVHHLNREHIRIVGRMEVAPLLKQSKLFIGFMEILLQDLLNKLFIATFKCTGTIFLFDFTTSPDKLVENKEVQEAVKQRITEMSLQTSQ